MFEWILGQLGKLRAANREREIARAFEAYDSEKRTEHVNLSLRKFSTGALEQELGRLMAEAREQVRNRYDTPTAELEKEAALIRSEIAFAKMALPALKRDYKAELTPLYEQLQVLAAEIKAARVTKQAAYERLDSAKSSIASWHNKSKRSPILFGNGGRALPAHSLFGQSLGDLDGYKAARSKCCA
jgi:hypothetical protein